MLHRRSIFDGIENEATQLIKEGWSLRKVYSKIKHKVGVDTSFSGFFYFVKKKKLDSLAS